MTETKRYEPLHEALSDLMIRLGAINTDDETFRLASIVREYACRSDDHRRHLMNLYQEERIRSEALRRQLDRMNRNPLIRIIARLTQ